MLQVKVAYAWIIKSHCTCCCVIINSLWPSDAIWRHKFGSAWSQIMACCLMAATHYLNQCSQPIDEVLWHSPESNSTKCAHAPILYDEFENYTFKITATSPRGQCMTITQCLGYFHVMWMWYTCNHIDYVDVTICLHFMPEFLFTQTV